MDTIKWGIIGCGNVVETKSGAAFQKASGSELLGVMRRDRQKAEAYAAKHGVPHVFDTAEALVSHPKIDAVYVATPPESHARLAELAAKHDTHCYVEKPMAMNGLECISMQNAFSESDARLFTAFYRRCLPGYLKIAEWLESGLIGDVLLIRLCRYQPVKANWPSDSVPWRFDPALSRGGLFSDLGAHTLDLIDFWFGPMKNVSGVAANQCERTGVEDAVTMQFETEGGIHGTGSWHFSAFEKEECNELIGTRGKITFTADPGAPIRLDTVENSATFQPDCPDPIQLPMVQAVTDAIRNGTTAPSDGGNGRRVQEIMDAVLDSP